MKLPANPVQPQSADLAARVHWWVVRILRLVLIAAMALALNEAHWLDAFLTLGIILIMYFPGALGRRLQLKVPTEFGLLALLFVFASLFLGEIRGYYTRFWWWDIALHATSGLLLGVFGFLLVFVLNEDDRVEFQMRPSFVALFAFMFAVACGTFWEIFEFTMDRVLGMDMQKAMLGDPSGLTDTIWDLIVDAAGAGLISLVGLRYMREDRKSFVDLWIRRFIDQNARLFRRKA